MNVVELPALKIEKHRRTVLIWKNTRAKQKLKRSIPRTSHCRSISLRLLQVALLKKIILCTGWINLEGVEKIFPALEKASRRNSEIILYTNKKHTDEYCINRFTAVRLNIDQAQLV